MWRRAIATACTLFWYRVSQRCAVIIISQSFYDDPLLSLLASVSFYTVIYPTLMEADLSWGRFVPILLAQSATSPAFVRSSAPQHNLHADDCTHRSHGSLRLAILE